MTLLLLVNFFASLDEQIHFLHEFCGLSKSLPMVQQLRLFRYVAFGAVHVYTQQQLVTQFVFSNFCNQLLLFDCILLII